jgi:hypothetical protein
MSDAPKEHTVGSVTHIYMCRARLKLRKAGRKRKNMLEKQGSTPTQAEFFGDTAKKTKAAK